MATTPTDPDQTPRADESDRNEAMAVPEEDGPHDVPDNEVIEHTLPADSKKDKPGTWRGDTSLPR